MRIVIVDDHAVARTGLRLMVGEAAQIVGEGETGRDAVRLCEETEPDLVLLDLQMPEMGGLEALALIRSRHPATRVLVLTVDEDPETVRSAVRAGASGYVSKSAGSREIAEALRVVRDGGTYMSPDIAGGVMRGFVGGGRETANGPRLTPRERETLALLAQGFSARSIAIRLSITERTVNTHITHCYRKLGVNNRVDAVLAGMRLRLVDVPA
ncbi:MAG TPA: response regulator transcription factor [Actinomycetota bacterium]|nr:response regulator transcription factor [Actinomycetota bacterium]